MAKTISNYATLNAASNGTVFIPYYFIFAIIYSIFVPGVNSNLN